MEPKTISYKTEDMISVLNLLNQLTIKGVENSRIIANIYDIIDHPYQEADQVEAEGETNAEREE